MTAIAELTLRADPGQWERVGLVIQDSCATVGGVRLRFEPLIANRADLALDPSLTSPAEPPVAAITGWGLAGLPSGAPASEAIDGLATYDADLSIADETPAATGIVGFDHLVVMTSSLERTCSAIAAASGEPLKRVREAGNVRQGFHRLGAVIVEVVESQVVTSATASFWGFVWNVVDIHELCAELGPELIGRPRPAVQPGRWIASFRREAGLGLPIAVMSAPVPAGS